MDSNNNKVLPPSLAVDLVPDRLVENTAMLLAYLTTKRDAFLIIVSKEGEGKSTIAQIIGAITNAFPVNGSPRYILESNLYDEEEFKGQVFGSTDKVIICDEGTSLFLRADSNSRWGRERVKLLSQMRSRRHVLIVTLTESGLARVDPQILHDRATALLRITKRGRFRWYSKQKLTQIVVDPMKRMVSFWPKCNWAGSFKAMPKKYYDAYEQHKHDALERANAGDEEVPTIMEEYIPIREAMKRLRICFNTMKKRCTNGTYRAMQDGARQWLVHNEDVRKAEQIMEASKTHLKN